MHTRLVRPDGILAGVISDGLTAPASPGTLRATIFIMDRTVMGLTGLGVTGHCAIVVGIGVLTSIVEATSSQRRRAATKYSES